jgi:hypothetical protein
MDHQALERLHHVMVAHIPGSGTAANHSPVVALRVLGDQCVLLGAEIGVTSVAGVLVRPGAEGTEHRYRLIFARHRNERGSAGVLLLILIVGIEAGVGPTSDPCSVGINVFQVFDHRRH